MKFILVIKLFTKFCFKVQMKRLNKIILLFLIALLSFNLSYSQDNKRSKKYSNELIETLSNYQKELIKKERKYLDIQRSSIRKTFSIEQKEIIADSTLTYYQKRKKIIESFSTDQNKLIKRYDERIDSIRKQLYTSLTEEQKILIKKKRKKSKKND